jgi:hypothetical protein
VRILEGSITCTTCESIPNEKSRQTLLAVAVFRLAPGRDGPDHTRRHTDVFYILQGNLDVGLGPGLAVGPDRACRSHDDDERELASQTATASR